MADCGCGTCRATRSVAKAWRIVKAAWAGGRKAALAAAKA